MFRLFVVLYLFFIVGVGILEAVLSRRWDASYCRYGIPIFLKTVPFYEVASSTTISYLLSREEPRSWGRSHEFSPVSENEVAFREKAEIKFYFLPHWAIMHGLITISPLERAITVKGYIDWTEFALIAFGTPLVLFAAYSDLKLILPALFAYFFSFITYSSQAKAYNRIVESLRDKGQLVNAQP
jgi:hypothetical protein